MLKSTTLKIILPLLPPSEIKAFEKVFPLDFFNGGMRDLIVCVLENQEGEDYFVTACFNKMEEELAYFDEESRRTSHELFFTNRVYNDAIKVMLIDFFAMYNKALYQVLGQAQISFVRVLSYRVNKGLYVELDYEPFSKTPCR